MLIIEVCVEADNVSLLKCQIQRWQGEQAVKRMCKGAETDGREMKPSVFKNDKVFFLSLTLGLSTKNLLCIAIFCLLILH